MTLTPRVVDISHHNGVHDLVATASAGIWGVIHKASEGVKYRDPDYANRRQRALDAGMLWGAYHFNNGGDVPTQVDNFLAAARPDRTTLLVLDYEDNPKSNMSPQQMVQFLRLIEQRVGRRAAIYSGNRMKETIGRLSPSDRAYVTSHELWLCQYGPRPTLPPGFSRSFLWQFTDGHFGPQPHGIAGITGDVDLNAFNGTRDDLERTWIFPHDAIISTDRSSHSAQVDEDAPPSQSRSDDDAALPPFMRAGGDATTGPQSGPVNVQPVRSGYSVEVEVAQRELDLMGYHEVGDVDGHWGGKTAAAIKAFFVDRDVRAPDGGPALATMGPQLNVEIGRAKSERFTRPIAPSRANATEKDIAPRNESVRLTLWQRFGAKIGAGVAGLGLTGSTLSSTFQAIQDKLQPVHDAFARIPPEVWFIVIGAVAGLVWYASTRAVGATTKDYNTGRLN